MLKAWFFGLVVALLAVPVAASAQLAIPTPAPAPTVAPSPRPTPVPERFVSIDGGFGGKTYTELAGGATTSGYAFRAVDEMPIIGHNWVGQVEYRSYNYAHKALGGQPNGLTFACAANDPGCVTPVGYGTYDRVLTPGPSIYVNAFNAQDTTTQFSLGSKIAPYERYYISAGYLLRSFNYLSYPVQSGFGVGLDKLPDVDRALSIYGSFWEYFTVHSLYTGPTSPALGTLSGATFNVNNRVFAYRFGATLNVPGTSFFVDLSDVGDRGDTVGNAPSSFTHNQILVGGGLHF